MSSEATPLTTQQAAEPLTGKEEMAGPRRVRSRLRETLGRWVFRALVVGILAGNAWYLYREFKPIPGPRQIKALIAQEKYEEAEEALRLHLWRSPRDGEARMDLARIRAARGDLVGCARELRKVPEWWPTKPEALFLEGKSLLQAGHAREAEAPLWAAVRDEPLHPTPQKMHKAASEELIQLYATEERWDEANAVIWETFERIGRADQANVLIMRTRTEVERISAETTAKRMRGILKADPGDWEARRALGVAEYGLGHVEEAKKLLRSCIEARPEDLHAWRDWLSLLRDRGDMAGMAEAIGELPPSADKDARLWYYRGLVLDWQRDFPGAAKAFRRSIEISPYDAAVFYRLALVERRLGHPEEAKQLNQRGKIVRAARDDLLDALGAFNDKVRAGAIDGPELAEEAKRLAKDCETLGHDRLARALRSLVR